MVLDNSYYFTSKIEIKPQRLGYKGVDYTDYFTSKIEIKPQPKLIADTEVDIILHQK